MKNPNLNKFVGSASFQHPTFVSDLANYIYNKRNEFC